MPNEPDSASLTSVELCAGGGGQAIGLEAAGFQHVALIEVDPHACATLRKNRPHWNVIEVDIAAFDGSPYRGVDLLAGGLPCPPWSVAGKRLGQADERNLLPDFLRLVNEIAPRAFLLENVPGLLDEEFDQYRDEVLSQLMAMGYVLYYQIVNVADYGVPQSRRRLIVIGMQLEEADFAWPTPVLDPLPTVGQVLGDAMASHGWEGADEWRFRANEVAPTLVGGSKKHGGPDLGPVRARKAWARLGVDGLGLADEPPPPDFAGMPRLTVAMTALLQGFPSDWELAGGKTAAYRQVGNAFPPPMARALGVQVAECLRKRTRVLAIP